MSRGTMRNPETRQRVAVAVMVALSLVLAVGVYAGNRRLNDRVDHDVKAAHAASERSLAEQAAETKRRTLEAQQRANKTWQAGLAPIAWPKGRPLSVEIYGDSVTYGMDATSEADTYRREFQNALQARGKVDYVVRAWPGAKAGDMVEAIDPRPDVDLSIVALGLNDAFKSTPIAKFHADYHQQIADVKAASPHTTLICEGLWQSRNSPAYQPYDATIQELCDKAGGYYVGLSDDFNNAGEATHGPPDLRVFFDDKKSDSIHPNDFGMRVIAYRLMERLPALIATPGTPENVTPGPELALLDERATLGLT